MRKIAVVSGALLAAFAVAVPMAVAGDLTPEKLAGGAAARSDAFLNLTDVVYSVTLSGGRTVRDMLAADVALREKVEAALRAACLVAVPQFEESGLARAVAELNPMLLPYEVRLKLRAIPRSICVDGAAEMTYAAQTAGAAAGDVTNEMKQWVEKTLEAEGKAQVPAGPNRDEAKDMARMAAAADALAALAKQVDELALDADATVKAFLTQHEDLRARLNATLSGADLTSESLDRTGATYAVKVSLPGKAVLRPLRQAGYRASRAKVLNADQMELARQNARADAVARLKQKIYGLPLGSGAKAGEWIERQAGAKAEIERLCRLTPNDEVRISEDGVVKVYVETTTQSLPRDLQGLLAYGQNPQITAVGAGLPISPKKPEPEKKPDSEKKPEEKAPGEKPKEGPAGKAGG